MLSSFHLMGASVVGRAHLGTSTPNQDSMIAIAREGILIGVVGDGCSAGRSSQVGSSLQTRYLAGVLLEGVEDGLRGEELLEASRVRLLGMFRGVAAAMEEPLLPILADMFLSTTIGVVMTEEETFIFRRGDGVYIINDDAPVILDEKNRPNYPAYDLEPSLGADPNFVICWRGATSDVRQILFGTDGLTPFVLTPDKLDCGGRPIGPLTQFFDPIFIEDDPDGQSLTARGQKRLAACGPYAGWVKSPLVDDTTFLRIQRRCVP